MCLDDFGTGTTEEIFQLAGKRPSGLKMLNSLVRDVAMLCAVHLSILADIPSGPQALLVSKDLMYARTSLAVQSRSSGQEIICML